MEAVKFLEEWKRMCAANTNGKPLEVVVSKLAHFLK